MAKNSNLHNAKAAKNDEFYTQLSDISNELKHYKEHFIGKVVFCNCDDPEWSNFWKYFNLNFDFLGLKKLIATHYDTEKQSYKLEMYRDDAGVHTDIKTLQQNGDFRSPECIELLKEADIVVTNPPFSLFREYVAQLMGYGKKFVIIGNTNAVTYKEIFPLLRDNKIWAGFSFNKTLEFIMPDSYELKGKAYVDDEGKKHGFVPSIAWYTNLDIKKRHEGLTLWKHYTPEEYPKYDNYDAINVDKVTDIPVDYDGVMGVPITFLDKYNPEQFEIVTFRKGENGEDLVFTREREREFNRTFVSLYDLDCRDDKKCRRQNQWEAYLCENNNQVEIEPIDFFYPIVARGCVEPCINLETIRRLGRAEIKSRQIKYNGVLCQKTYHRLLIRKKAGV